MGDTHVTDSGCKIASVRYHLIVTLAISWCQSVLGDIFFD